MKSFLICHLGALGDFILTWPALHCLRKILTNYHFLGIGRGEYMHLAVHLDVLDSGLDIETTRMFDFFSGESVPPKMGCPQGAVLWLSKARDMAALLRRTASLPVITVDPIPENQMHVAYYYCQAIQTYFPIEIPKNLAECFPHRAQKGQYALIHSGSGSPKKNYRTRFYRGLADELRQNGYPKVGFIFGPVERERNLADEFAGEWIEQPANLRDLADLLAGAALYIGNDSGVSHLSGFLGTPTIALYKTTDPKIWGVLGRKVVHISAIDEASARRQVCDCLQSW